MATKVSTGSTFDPSKNYKITVSEVVKVGSLLIRPKNGGTVSGEVAETIKDKITSHEAVE